MLGSGLAQTAQPRRFGGRRPSGLETPPDAGLDPDFIPKLTADVVDMHVIDRIVPIANADALRCSRDLAQKEGIFVGITAGGTFAGALARLRRGAGRRDRLVHAAGHRRTLSEHAAVCGHSNRYE